MCEIAGSWTVVTTPVKRCVTLEPAWCVSWNRQWWLTVRVESCLLLSCWGRASQGNPVRIPYQHVDRPVTTFYLVALILVGRMLAYNWISSNTNEPWDLGRFCSEDSRKCALVSVVSILYYCCLLNESQKARRINNLIFLLHLWLSQTLLVRSTGVQNFVTTDRVEHVIRRLFSNVDVGPQIRYVQYM